MLYESDQWSSIANRPLDLISSTTRVNYVLTYLPDDASWELSVGARNLTNEEDVVNSSVNSGPAGAIYNVRGRGREAYVQYKYSFGE